METQTTLPFWRSSLIANMPCLYIFYESIPINLVLDPSRHSRSVISRSFVLHLYHLMFLASSTWRTWSFFHKQLDFSPAVQPCLRFTNCDIDPDVLRRWEAESLHTILLPISLFSWQSEVFPPFFCESFCRH